MIAAPRLNPRLLACHMAAAEPESALPRVEKRSAARWLVPIIPCLGLVALVIEWVRWWVS